MLIIFLAVFAVIIIAVFGSDIGTLWYSTCWKETLDPLDEISGIGPYGSQNTLGADIVKFALKLDKTCVLGVVFADRATCNAICDANIEGYDPDHEECFNACKVCPTSGGCIIAVPKNPGLGEYAGRKLSPGEAETVKDYTKQQFADLVAYSSPLKFLNNPEFNPNSDTKKLYVCITLIRNTGFADAYTVKGDYTTSQLNCETPLT